MLSSACKVSVTVDRVGQIELLRHSRHAQYFGFLMYFSFSSSLLSSDPMSESPKVMQSSAILTVGASAAHARRRSVMHSDSGL